MRELWSDRNFTYFWAAQVLYAGVNGTLRFTFIWLVVTLTEWPAAEGLVAIALGVPAMLLSLPAGAWSDRVNRKAMYVWGTLASTIALVVFTGVIMADRATPTLTGIAAFVIGAALVINLPNVQAMVPLIVDEKRLMNAVALQNGGSQAAGFAGLAVGGLAISVFGDAGGFAMLTVVCFLALLLMLPVRLPSEAATGEIARREGMWRSIRLGARFGLSADPLRSLLIVSLVLGSSFSVMQVSMPRVVDEVYGRGSSAAGLVLGAFGFGMLISSAAVAGRDTMRHGVNVARYIGVGLGLGQLLLSFAPNVAIAIVVMVAWGLNAGVAIASHRTLIQTNTPPEMMGRVMGLMMFGFAGGLPFGALASSLLAPQVGPANTMRIVGAITICITLPLLWRRPILELR